MVIVGVLLALEVCFFLFYGGGLASIFGYFHKDTSFANQLILFEGDKCANCTTVENFIKKNNIEATVTFSRLEVFNHPANANILADKAQICGLSTEQIGVPFLWDGKNKKCIVGYVDVIAFFRQASAKKP